MLPFDKPIKANKQLEKNQKNIFRITGCNFEEKISKIFKNKKTCQKDDDTLIRDIQAVTRVSQTKHAESSRNTSSVDDSDVPGCNTENEKQSHRNSNIEPYIIKED